MKSSAIKEPPRPFSPSGEIRCVGVEIEYIDLDLEETARLVQSEFGGRIVTDNPYVFHVEATSLGDFEIEIDASFLKDRILQKTLGEKVERLVGAATRTLAPKEIVCPPIPFRRLTELRGLRQRLVDAGARGTNASLLYAFGLHLNPEVPAFDVDTLLNIMRAYGMLEESLHDWLEVDLSRELVPFIDPYPKVYVDKIVAEDYAPELSILIDDYLAFNPTRFRGLDMLPLFAHLDEERVARVLGAGEIKPRPTYHYRLPNSTLKKDDDLFVQNWNRWVFLEEIAEDRALLLRLMRQYRLARAGGKEDAFHRTFHELHATRKAPS